MNVCVYCASSDDVRPAFLATADELGRLLGERGWTLIYGGSNVGLMGRLACAVHDHGGRVVGIIPELRVQQGVACTFADELVVTRDLRERKGHMDTRGDAFVVLPGGFGTLEELMEMLTLKQLGYHAKPIVLVNAEGFYNPLLELFEHFFRERFAPPTNRELYRVVATPAEAVAVLAAGAE